jgi:Cu(I)/Ag(I) efflux system protein CusF
MRTSIVAAVVAGLLSVAPAIAQKSDHSGHGGHPGHAMSDTSSEVKAGAVIHSVDAKKSMINVTHDPVPALQWPQMTMDLPVTKRVDLSKIKAGDKVTIILKQGVDKQFRVVDIAPTK